MDILTLRNHHAKIKSIVQFKQVKINDGRYELRLSTGRGSPIIPRIKLEK